jgi:hypothetical protein
MDSSWLRRITASSSSNRLLGWFCVVRVKGDCVVVHSVVSMEGRRACVGVVLRRILVLRLRSFSYCYLLMGAFLANMVLGWASVLLAGLAIQLPVA